MLRMMMIDKEPQQKCDNIPKRSRGDSKNTILDDISIDDKELKARLFLDLLLKHFPGPAERAINDSGRVHERGEMTVSEVIEFIYDLRKIILAQLDVEAYQRSTKDFIQEFFMTADIEPSSQILALGRVLHFDGEKKEQYDEILERLLRSFLEVKG